MRSFSLKGSIRFSFVRVLRKANESLETFSIQYLPLNLNRSQLLHSQVPKFVPSKSGDTFVRLSNGAQACVTELIPGGLPKLTCVQDIGRASGELNSAMGRVVQISAEKCNSAPYYEIWDGRVQLFSFSTTTCYLICNCSVRAMHFFCDCFAIAERSPCNRFAIALRLPCNCFAIALR
jgi:hypothetical protein